jgi:UDP-N-acetylglucosamine--N-acetylmuramyl-(pentapeptide) pyrophosphoryl-undecaprenol N-acetylglucosamine transferase
MALAERGVILAGGGTGGHIFPALALAEAIRKRAPHTRVSFVGTARGLEARLVPAAGFELDLVPGGQVLGRGVPGQLRGLAALLAGIARALRLLRARRAELVVGVGGYASVPAAAAALLLRVPIALLEPNARPGRANRLLGRFARAVFVQFDEACRYFPSGRCERLGLPVRPIPPRGAPASDGRLRLVVAGGSQGARSVNRAVCAALPRLDLSRVEITHQTGEADAAEVQARYAAAGVRARIAAFFDDLPERLAGADLVVARAGAGTIAELCAAGAPSILVPYPFAADDHQLANARELEREGACVIVRDAELDSALLPALQRLLGDPAARAALGAAAARRAQPDAAERIAQRCARLAGETSQ